MNPFHLTIFKNFRFLYWRRGKQHWESQTSCVLWVSDCMQYYFLAPGGNYLKILVFVVFDSDN